MPEFYEKFLVEDFEMLNRTINTLHSLSLLTIDKLLSASEEDLKEAELAAYRIIHQVEVVKALRKKKISRDGHQHHPLAQSSIYDRG